MNYIITKRKEYFDTIGKYKFCEITSIILPEIIAIDTETDSLTAYVKEHNIFAIQIGTGNNNYLFDIETLNIWDVFNLIKNKTLVFANAKFDLGWFYKYDFYPNKIRDVQIASMILNNGDETIYSHSLASLYNREMDINLIKDEQKNISTVKLSTKKAIQYCFDDVDKLLELNQILENKVKNYGSYEAYLLNCEFLKPLAYLEYCGLPIDSGYWVEKVKNDFIEQQKNAELIKEYIYINLPKYRDLQLDLFENSKKILPSLTSVQQMIPVFEDLNIVILDDKGKPSINSKVLSKVNHDFLDLWRNFKEYERAINTYNLKMLERAYDGRFYTSFRPIIDTCRIASRQNEINFLNFPSNEKTRNSFRSKEGWVIIDADYDSQEKKMLAALSDDYNSKKIIINGIDPHCELVRAIYPELKDLSDREIAKNHKPKRQIAKGAGLTENL